MKLVCVDNHVLVWGIKEQAVEGQEEMIPRTKAFFDECRKNDVQVMVPSVVVGELLTAVEPRYHAMTLNLLKSSFIIAPYDGAASAIFARLWRDRKESGLIDKIREELQATRQELKADCMIVATGIAQKADAIYSHDDKLKKFANGSIRVLEIPRVQIQGQLGLVDG